MGGHVGRARPAEVGATGRWWRLCARCSKGGASRTSFTPTPSGSRGCYLTPGFGPETVMDVRAVRAGLRISEAPSFGAERRFGEANPVTLPMAGAS